MKNKNTLILVFLLTSFAYTPARCFHSNSGSNFFAVMDYSFPSLHDRIDKDVSNLYYEMNDNPETGTSLSFIDTVNYHLVCVDSVWYEPGNNILINVRVYNGDVNNLNYPSVQIVSPAGDTVGNPNNMVTYFAHIGNSFMIYTDTITDTTITSFSNYTFLISEGFGDTTAVINWCATTGINEIDDESFIVYPNPAEDYLIISGSLMTFPTEIDIYNATGQLVLDKSTAGNSFEKIDVSHFSPGIYFLVFSGQQQIKRIKFLKL